MASVVIAEVLVRASECVISHNVDSCKILAEDYSIKEDRQLEWLTMLATRRDTYIIPATNCLGHLHHVRTEQSEFNCCRHCISHYSHTSYIMDVHL